MRIRQERQFEEDFAALPDHIQRRARKQLALLLSNPRHPSLRIKKMEGQRDIWEGRISRDHRFTFEIIGDLYKLRRIGSHDILKRP
jgi:mRNA-degrading endonuclease YafQ of YafQ-DinJ toxin-antitoxin module